MSKIVVVVNYYQIFFGSLCSGIEPTLMKKDLSRHHDDVNGVHYHQSVSHRNGADYLALIKVKKTLLEN